MHWFRRLLSQIGTNQKEPPYPGSGNEAVQLKEAVSPLIPDSLVRLIEVISTDRLIEDWRKNLQIDIADEVGADRHIYRYQCDRTLLQFYLPTDVEGSGELYRQLEKIDWYYMPHRWEHDTALQDLQNCQKVIEIGAGQGAFVDRLQKMGWNATGIELNPSAVAHAKQQNIPVEAIDLYQLAQTQKEHYDAVCAFQVLEHVTNPKDFLAAMVQLIKPGGQLIIAVPNSQSFPKHLPNNLFDQPPHHMTRWCRRTFESLTALFSVQIEHFSIEPLADYHIDWYLSIQETRFKGSSWSDRLILQVIRKYLPSLLKRSAFVRSLIPGHTLYVCFKKLV